MKTNRLSLIDAGLALLIVMIGLATPAWAANYHFALVNSTGDFHTAANWSPVGVPSATDTVYVLYNGTVRITNDASVTNMWLGNRDYTGAQYLTGAVELVSGIFSNAGTLYMGGGNVGKGGRGTFVQTGGTCNVHNINIAHNGLGGDGYGLYVLSNGYLKVRRWESGGGWLAPLCVGVGGTGRLEVAGGIIQVNGMLGVGICTASPSTVVQSGGSISAGKFYLGTWANSTYYMSGGSLLVTNQGEYSMIDFGDRPNNYAGRFIQTGGNVEFRFDSYNYGLRLYNSDSLYEISGGSFTQRGGYLFGFVTGSVFRIIGSAPSIEAPFLYLMNTNSCWEYMLDKSSPHISRMVLTNQSGAGLAGYLKVGLRGGALLAATNYFPLVQCYNATSTWNNLPDTNMWAWYRSGGTVITGLTGVCLSTNQGAYYRGQLDMNGTKSASFSALARGYMRVANLNTNAMGNGLAVYLNVDAATYGNTVTNLVAQLVAAGYTNSAADSSGGYNLRVVIPKTCLTANNPSYFLWDFTDTTLGTTNAVVSGLRVINWPVRAGTVFTTW